MERYFNDFRECMAEVPGYQGRYSPQQQNLVLDGRLEAGMPQEFALMVLGPPTQPPGSVSLLDPTTKKVEWRTTYTWDAAAKRQDVAFAFSLASAFALGVAGVTSDYNTLRKALAVAALADVGKTLASKLPARGAATVTTEVDADGTIRTLAFSIAPVATTEKAEE
jgi:hypothetical protein